MELMISLGIGLLTASGIYLILRERTFSVILGITLLSYATNLLIFVSGRLVLGAPPLVVPGQAQHTDSIPQALVLTAIVISFGMTAYIVALALRAKGESGTDHVDAEERPR
ncbi:MAG: Na+/H+ antiporter subunit C [Hyphomicrobiaceae bacterium]|nr:Na+/H+ antiporter subunit C [Hyphomicrobiaceae bacterium]